MANLRRDDELLRRVLDRPDFLMWHDDEGRWVPSLAGVRFDPDGMSVFVLRLLEANRRGPADVATLGGTKSEQLVFAASTSSIEELGFTAQHTPNNLTPIGDAHASVKPPPDVPQAAFRALRTDLATALRCVHGTPSLTPPPATDEI